MSDPTDSDPTDTSTPGDTDPTDPDPTDAAEIVMDDVEVAADFLDDLGSEAHPSVLRITSTPEAQHRADALERAQRWEAGEAVPRVINFQNPSDLRALLTDRRVELLQSIMDESPDSIRQLASRVDRNVKSVHDDLQVLTDYGIVHFEQAGRAKRPFVPYETIEVTLEISAPSRAVDDAAPA